MKNARSLRASYIFVSFEIQVVTGMGFNFRYIK